MLQYEHEPHAQSEKQVGSSASLIKVEAPESANQSEKALYHGFWTRASEKWTSKENTSKENTTNGCDAHIKVERDTSVINERMYEKSPEINERTERSGDHAKTSFVNADLSSAVDHRLKRVSLLHFGLLYQPSAKSESATSTCNASLEKKVADSLEVRFGIRTYSKCTKLSKIVKQEGSLASCENALICKDTGVTKERYMPSKKSHEVCKTMLCLDTTVPKTVNRLEADGHVETATSKVDIQLTTGKPNNESIDLAGNCYQCSYCEKKFDKWKKFSAHKKVHTNKPLRCSQCPKCFVSSSRLERHEKLHARRRPRQCPVCEESFSSFDHLRHHKLTHRGEKPFHCSMCDMKFARADSLRKHEKTHARATRCIESEKKTFQCPYCGKIFLTLGQCREHERMHTGDRPFQCSYCDRSFSYLASLRSHERVHTGERPYQCSHCSKSFSHATSLKRHESSHSGERGYECKYCEKRFNRSENLKDHERVHTGEKPYECPRCNRRFTRSQQLKVHSRTHIPKQPISSCR